MIDRILELQSLIMDMPNLEALWYEVKELKEILKYPYIVTKKLQWNNLTPGVFYIEWKSLITA